MATTKKQPKRTSKKKPSLPTFGVSRRLQYFFIMTIGVSVTISLIPALYTLVFQDAQATSLERSTYLVLSVIMPIVVGSVAYLAVGRRLARDVLGQLFASVVSGVAAFNVVTSISLLISGVLEAFEVPTENFVGAVTEQIIVTGAAIIILLLSLCVKNLRRLQSLTISIFAISVTVGLILITADTADDVLSEMSTNPSLSTYVGGLVFAATLAGLAVTLLSNRPLQTLTARLFDAAVVASTLFAVLSIIQTILYEYMTYMTIVVLDRTEHLNDLFTTLQTVFISCTVIVMIAFFICVARRRSLVASRK